MYFCHPNFLEGQGTLGEKALTLFLFLLLSLLSVEHTNIFSAFKKLTRRRPKEETLPQRDAMVINLGTVSLFILTMQIFKSLYES